MIDLGLPSGTKWACCNVGASKPEEYGDYFAWGEIKPKSSYTESNYFDSSYLKYSTSVRTELLPEDDAAYVNWGQKWRMPSKEQCEELINSSYTTIEKTTMNSINGRKITSKMNGNSIFLPAAGCRYDTSLSSAGSYGGYWSRTFYSGYSNCAWDMSFYDSYSVDLGGSGREGGQSVRPVSNQ